MARPRNPNKMIGRTLRLPEEAWAEIDARAARRNQTSMDWLRDQLTKALLKPENPEQAAQASKHLAAAADVSTASARGEVEPRWKDRDKPKAAKAR